MPQAVGKAVDALVPAVAIPGFYAMVQSGREKAKRKLSGVNDPA